MITGGDVIQFIGTCLSESKNDAKEGLANIRNSIKCGRMVHKYCRKCEMWTQINALEWNCLNNTDKGRIQCP